MRKRKEDMMKRFRRRRPGVLVAGALVILLLLVGSVIGWRLFKAQTPADLAKQVRVIADIPLSGGVSRFDYQSLDQQRGLLFIAHLGASTVSVFDTRTRTVVADIPAIAGVHGVLVVPELGRVYASATDANQVAVIDEQTLHVLTTIPGGDYPDGLAYDPALHRLFISDETGQTDTVIDTQTNQRIATIPLGGEAGNTQYDPISQRVFVDVQTQNQLVAIDPATNQILARYALPGCQHDHSLLIEGNARLAFVTCDSNNVLLVVDLAHAMQVLSVQPVGETPDVLTFDTKRKVLYVACESGVVSVFQEQGHTVRKVGDQFVAPEAHSIAVDQQTHQVYLPLEEVGGKPVLRIAVFRLAQGREGV
jgi:YVTN family beta-propeller protein